ncbi:MAG: hypothetical protein R3A49_00970 [Acidimicrobiia bacterium]
MDNESAFCTTGPVVTIDCDSCAMRETDACDDCLVNVVVNREPGEAVVFDAAEERSLRALAGEGMVPRLRYFRSVG